MSAAGLAAEVIVVGAGPVGSALAALLGAHGVECMLIGSRATGRSVPGNTPTAGRALALTLASRNILHAASAWERLPAAAIGQFQRMRVWDANGPGVIEFDSAELCLPALGYVVEQALLEDALGSALGLRRCVSAIPSGPPESLIFREDRVVLRLDDGRELAARLIIGADGFASRVRGLAGIDYPVHEYSQQAVCCTVETAEPHADTARQRFLPDGPLAFLPLAARRQCAVIWSTSPEHAHELLDAEAGAFGAQLASAFEQTLGGVTAISARASFPLRRAQAERYCRPRLVLAGDAAHCVHPLAGQGANLGLLDAASLAQILVAARERGLDIGALGVLRRYERWRRGDNAAMILALDGLQRLFGARSGALQWARNTGLDLVNGSGPVKDLIMRLATGMLGDLPALALRPLPA